MTNYSEEFAKKKFAAETMKEAYLKAAKWVATYVLSKIELQSVIIGYEKDKQYPIITVHLYASLPEQEVKDQHCKCCEEMHHTFFINENNNCNICAVAGFQNRIQQKIKLKTSYYRELLKKQAADLEDE